jgi:hypothetical protein
MRDFKRKCAMAALLEDSVGNKVFPRDGDEHGTVGVARPARSSFIS